MYNQNHTTKCVYKEIVIYFSNNQTKVESVLQTRAVVLNKQLTCASVSSSYNKTDQYVVSGWTTISNNCSI